MFPKLRFSGLIKFFPSSVFGELQLTQISLNFKTSCCNLKIRSLEPNCVWLFHHFNFKRNYDLLRSKSPFIVLNKNINFYKNKTESKMGNPTHSFRKTQVVVPLIEESQIKSKIVTSWSLRKKKEGTFCTAYFVRWKVFNICVLSQCLVY